MECESWEGRKGEEWGDAEGEKRQGKKRQGKKREGARVKSKKGEKVIMGKRDEEHEEEEEGEGDHVSVQYSIR